METATIEAPPTSALNPNPAPAAPPARQSLAEAAKATEVQMRTGKPPEAAPSPPAAKPDAKPDAAKAPEAKPAATPPAKKPTGLEALKAKNTPNGADKPAAAAAPDDEKPGEQSRWMELKAAEKRLKEIEPEYDATKKEKEAWQQERAQLMEERKELEALRRERDFTDVSKSDTYKKEVEVPYQKVAKIAKDVADYAQVDPRALMDAMREPNSLLRAKAIKAVLENGKEEVADISELVSGGGALQDIFARHDELHQNASTLKAQHDNQKNAEKLKADTEAAEIMKRAHSEMRDIIKNRAVKTLGEDAINEAFEAAQNAPNDPMDVAYSGQAGHLFTQALDVIDARDVEIKQLKADLAAATNARPGIKPDAAKEAGKRPDAGSLSDAVAAHKATGGHL